MTCSSPPPITHFSIVIPYPGAPGAPFFDGQNITHFLDLYDQLCSDYRLSESEKIYRLPWYCEYFIGRYVRILIKDADWTAVRAILRREYKENDLDQLMYSREFLEALKKKPRSEDDDFMHYCRLFASISKDLVSRKRLDRYTQCQWFLQELLERIVMEIFYWYDIDLEDDDGLDFEYLLEKALVLVKRRKCLADLIQDRETNAHTGLEEKAPSPPNIVERFTYSAQDLTLPRFHIVQATVQDILVVRVHTLRAEEVKASKVSSTGNAKAGILGMVEPSPEDLLDEWSLNSDPAEDFYEDLDTLFTDLQPGDEKVRRFHADFVTIFELFDDAIGLGNCTQRPDTSSKNTSRKFLSSFKAGIGAKKKSNIISGEEFAGFDGIFVEPGAMKSEDHG